MKRKSLYLLVGFALSLGMFSCIKTEFVPQGDGGSTFMKFNDGPEKKIYFSPFSEIKTVSVLDLRRDANSKAALQTAQTIKLTLAPSMITNYNAHNGENFEVLPESIFTFASDASIVRNTNQFSFNFAAGDFAKELKINLDGSKWDLSKKFALAFKITDAAGNKVVDGMDSILVLISIKNKFDGAYELKIRTTGWSAYSIAENVTGTYPGFINLLTKTANSVTSYSTYYDANLLNAITATGGATAFGATAPIFIFDNATNKLTDVQNTIPDDGRGRKLQLNPAVTDSRYDPATKTVYAAFIMMQTGRPNQYFYDTLTYKKAR